MTTNSVSGQLITKLSDKQYRDAFAAEGIYSVLPLKIWSLREQRKLSQRELGDKIGVTQAWVSKLEDPNYGKLTLSTLLRLASAFDVGLEVDFVPFSKILGNASTAPESFQVASFAEDKGLTSRRETSLIGQTWVPRAGPSAGRFVNFGTGAKREPRRKPRQRFSGGACRVLKMRPLKAA